MKANFKSNYKLINQFEYDNLIKQYTQDEDYPKYVVNYAFLEDEISNSKVPVLSYLALTMDESLQ